MTIEELYNILEKAIDSGRATLTSDVYVMRDYPQKSRLPIIDYVRDAEIDSDGDLILLR